MEDSRLKRFGKYVIKKMTSNAIGKAIRYGIGGLFCYFGPVTAATTIIATGPVGIVTTGTILGVVYGTNLVENNLSKLVIK